MPQAPTYVGLLRLLTAPDSPLDDASVTMRPKPSYLVALLTVALIGATCAVAQTTDAPNPDRLPESANTPTDPSGSEDDQKVTSQIQQALAADRSLSSLVRYISIVTNAQAVVLRGSVRAADKERINTVAQQFAGTRQVDDQLTIKDH